MAKKSDIERKKKPAGLKKNSDQMQAGGFADAVINSLTAHIAVLDENGDIIAVNKAWQTFAESNPPPPHNYGVGSNYLYICDNAHGERAEEAPAFAKAIRAVMKGKTEYFSAEYPCNSPDTKRWFMGKVTSIPGNGVPRVVISHEDITDRKISEAALMESEAKANAITNSSMDGIILIDGKGVIEYLNRAAEMIFGFTKNEIIGKKLHDVLVSKSSRKEYYRRLPDFEKTGLCKVIGKTLELTVTKKNRTKIPVELLISSFQMKGEWHSVGTVRDITSRKQLENELRTAAVTDELTGLYNRRGFFTLAEQQCKLAERNNKKMALLYIDLDNLKTINDELGHDEGDMALIDTANVLKKTFRKSDVIGRLGGDEFSVLITELSGRHVERIVTENLMNTLASHNHEANRKYTLSLSKGFVFFEPGTHCTIDGLLTQADILMYEHKKQSR
jgi:diguanylate cyclase (GGDEF)-like protein/PAS domain S-box-containing protein